MREDSHTRGGFNHALLQLCSQPRSTCEPDQATCPIRLSCAALHYQAAEREDSHTHVPDATTHFSNCAASRVAGASQIRQLVPLVEAGSEEEVDQFLVLQSQAWCLCGPLFLHERALLSLRLRSGTWQWLRLLPKDRTSS